MKDIILKAIGEDKVVMYMGDSKDTDQAYNLAKAEMRANIPQIVEEVMTILQERQNLFNFIPQDAYGYKRVKTTDLNIMGIIKSLTENK